LKPKQKKIVKHFKGEKPIFTKYQLEDQIASIYKKDVTLKSGGFLVVEQTEAHGLIADGVVPRRSSGDERRIGLTAKKRLGCGRPGSRGVESSLP